MMQKLIAELEAKAYHAKSIDCKFFFAWNMFAEAKRMGLTIDGNALADPVRSAPEVAKMMHVCAVLYMRTAQKLGVDCSGVKIPEVCEVEAWLSICASEAAEAMRFLHDQMTEGKADEEVKKKPQPNESLTEPTKRCKSQTQSKRTSARRWTFWRGSAKKVTSSES